MHGALIAAIALATLVLILSRPWGLEEGYAAVAGAAACVVFGIVSPTAAVSVIGGEWNVLLFFLGLMTLSALCEQTDFFEWLARMVVKRSQGSSILLFVLVCATVIITTIFLTNDVAALSLTPIIFAVVARAGLEPLPFLFATTFLANAASLILPISNPLNFIVADGFSIRLTPYAFHMVLPELASVVVTLAILGIVFRHDIRGRILHTAMPAGPSRRAISATGIVLCLTMGGYFVASALGVPLGIVALAGAAGLLLVLAVRGGVDLRRLGSAISWQIFGFFVGMVVIVQGLARSGFLHALGHVLVSIGGSSPVGVTSASAVLAAVGSNLINNLPAALALTATLHQHLGFSASARRAGAYGTIIGADLGPNLTYVGSLSSMIWLLILRKRGLDISAMEYLRIGAIVAPLSIAATTGALLLTVK